MDRKQLLDTLELLNPALADDNLVPIFQQFCFAENSVYAYKDSLGIVAPLESDAEFAAHGRTLFDLLKKSTGKEVDFGVESEHLTIKVGRSNIKLPYYRKDEFLFEEPEDETWQIILPLDGQLIEAMKLCLVTSSTDSTMPAFMGVTVRGGKGVTLYSCDGDALSRYRLSDDKSPEVQYTIPNAFCESIIRIADKTGFTDGQLYVNAEWALCEFGNDFRVFGRVIENPEPIDFEKQIKKAMKSEPTYVEIPELFKDCLNRARVVADNEGKSTNLTVKGEKLIVSTDTLVGAVKDTLPIDKAHGDVSAPVASKLIYRAVEVCETFAITETVTAYKKGDEFLLIIANYIE